MSARPSRIKPPPRVAAILDGDAALAGATRTALADFEPWLEDNKLVFFPEYTDHGPDHIHQVLATASSLVADEVWPILTAADMAALVLSVLLHDCAMHLSEDGFIVLVTGGQTPSPSGEPPWPDLWRQFLGEASRFDGRKLTALFGSPVPIRTPPLDAGALTRADRLLIGEFLRRHHARLAHEIATDGIPGPGRERLGLRSVPPWLANLSGLIARSHGMPIRAAAERLPKYERRVSRDVHAPFLMAVLRIADYLQVHSERAPAALLQVRGLSSPVSRGEWGQHAIIETIHAFDDDPEALFIVARPRGAAEFTKARALFDSIQRELDESWALLGEIYGRVPGLSTLGLTLRRIKSNLDDRAEFEKSVDYVPVAASFTSAGGELLQLLVGPLYQNDPHVAIRELVQNAVDAVNEHRDYLGIRKQRALTDFEPDVVVDLNTNGNGTGSLTIADRGIGMTADTVISYFLRAGASFRSSDAWREQHTTDGHTRVTRSGRFGVGALAAFLAGDRIHVTTRHVSSPMGIEFSASIDDPLIELKQISREVGTTVVIELRQAAVWKFREGGSESKWDWYCLSDPLVQRRHNGLLLRQQTVWPPAGGKLPSRWERISVPGYSDLQFTFSPTEPAVVSNGIIVSRTQRAPTLSDSGQLQLVMPNLSVFDGDSALPLDLQRSHFIEPLPFAGLLRDSLICDIIATLIRKAPEDPGQALTSRFGHPALPRPPAPFRSWLWWTPRGWTITHGNAFEHVGTDRLLVAAEPEPVIHHFDPSSHALMQVGEHSDPIPAIHSIVSGSQPWWPAPAAAMIFIPYDRTTESWIEQNPKLLARPLRAEFRQPWLIVSWGDPFEPSIDVEAIVNHGIAERSRPFFAEILLAPWQRSPYAELQLLQRWREILPGGVIPAASAERDSLLRHPLLAPFAR